MIVTNNGNVPLGLAVWTLYDEYDYIDEPNYVSATGLLKPLRHIVLPRRVPKELRTSDIADYVSRALGKSLHDSIEKAWTNGSYRKGLAMMGYPESAIARIVVNPTLETLNSLKDPIPVYIEQRSFKQITVNGVVFTVGGKFDMVTEGIVTDNKSTTVFAWLYGGKDDDYKLQGSIYRWLNHNGYHDVKCEEPIGVNRITEDFIRINFIFTDWSRGEARRNPNYPQSRLMSKEIELMSLEETEKWIHAKLAQVYMHKDTPEAKLPECTDEELWRSAPVHKYYSDPTKTSGRSTKNFDNLAEAKTFEREKGKGIVITTPGEVKRCEYCEAFPICTQKDRYFQ